MSKFLKAGLFSRQSRLNQGMAILLRGNGELPIWAVNFDDPAL